MDSDPFRHSRCSWYYWKVIAVGYLVLCVLLAVIYVAVYAEQHGLYGSYYDNLENLGRPLTPQAENVSCTSSVAVDMALGEQHQEECTLFSADSILPTKGTVYFYVTVPLCYCVTCDDVITGKDPTILPL